MQRSSDAADIIGELSAAGRTIALDLYDVQMRSGITIENVRRDILECWLDEIRPRAQPKVRGFRKSGAALCDLPRPSELAFFSGRPLYLSAAARSAIIKDSGKRREFIRANAESQRNTPEDLTSASAHYRPQLCVGVHEGRGTHGSPVLPCYNELEVASGTPPASFLLARTTKGPQ